MKKISIFLSIGSILGMLTFAIPVLAAAPSGNEWFQLNASPFTGADNTGDGGTGNAADLNYYYVGQSFTGTMQINASAVPGTTAANIWIDYATTTVSSTSLTTGSYYASWSSQSIDPNRFGSGIIRSSGFNPLANDSSGLGNFGTVNFNFTRPTAANYSYTGTTTLDIVTGVIGATTESNISKSGTDLLDDAEDFQLHVWADTRKPFAETNNIASGTTNVSVTDTYQFRLFDTRDGEGGSTSTAYNAGGVGTGVNTATPPGSINFSPSHFTPTTFDAYSCSGIWGTNTCNVTIDPPSPTGMPSDTRNWNYAQLYCVTVSNYQDMASPSQNQLGDSNGPNTMDPKIFCYTTEPDTVAPQVVSETPIRASTGNSISTNIIINVEDRKSYPSGPSGVGVVTSTCQFNVSSPSTGLNTYNSVSPEVTVIGATPSGFVGPWGIQFSINPATNFAQNETVSVSAYNCQDTVGNIMTTDNWTFSTADSDPPFVTSTNPYANQVINVTSTIAFDVLDLGTGVDVSNTVIYVNGTYYTNSGGAGNVTISGTRISFASSLNFNGGNYVGDTTARSSIVNGYHFLIDPQSNFNFGETATVIVYSRDTSNNIMERVVYSMPTEGVPSGSCPSGSTFCGSNTSWNGSQCIGTGGSVSCPVSGGGGSTGVIVAVNEITANIIQVDEDSVLVSWNSNSEGSSRVVFGPSSANERGPAPLYGYALSTPERDDKSNYHAVQIDGLETGKVFYFRPISRINGVEAVGNVELQMAPVFGKRVETIAACPVETPSVQTEPNKAVTPITSKSTSAPTRIQPPLAPSRIKPVKIINIDQPTSKQFELQGQAEPNSLIQLIVY
ncbi:hypothetical protein IT408_03515 [Candidatus Uhrbacteria bacterium]|nr:hypothetical protein [Candidatus Uhrbacteria bacterium]